MRKRKYFHHMNVFLILVLGLMLFPFFRDGTARAAANDDCKAEEDRSAPTTFELTLSKEWKGRAKEVRSAFKTGPGAVRVQLEFFPIEPPMNIAIGSCVSADMARFAIRQAIAYNRGVEKLVIQNVVPHHWIGIGTTRVAELTWVPIGPEDLKRLTDPSLSTEAFQNLYRELARLKERKRPFGMEPVPYDQNGGPAYP